MAVGQIVGERWRVRVLTFGGPFFNKSVVGRCRGKRSFDPGCSPDYGFCFRRRESVFVAELCGFFAIHQIPSEFVICRPPAAFS